jgi:two-component system sensor histidine kinase TctE
MALVLAASLVATRREALQAANAAYDRSLLGAIKGLDLNVSTASGGLAVEQPYRLFEFFQLTAAGPVHYRVATDDGLVEIGSPDLPAPPAALRSAEPAFYDASYFGEAVRVGALMRPLDPPVGSARQVLIQVAEGSASRERFTQAFVRQALWRDSAVLGLLAIAALGASAWALHPVRRLAEATRRRAADDLSPLQAGELGADLQPLVDAINQQLARTQQLLALARADAAGLQREPVDLGELAREVALALLPQARTLGLDFGVEAPDAPLVVRADRGQLHEALRNLVHNALVHVGSGAHVTVEAGADAAGWWLGVVDDGPGLDAEVAAHAGERFAKGRGSRGSGLGLSIARAVIERHGGRLELGPGEAGRGLRARLCGRIE